MSNREKHDSRRNAEDSTQGIDAWQQNLRDCTEHDIAEVKHHRTTDGVYDAPRLCGQPHVPTAVEVHSQTDVGVQQQCV